MADQPFALWIGDAEHSRRRGRGTRLRGVDAVRQSPGVDDRQWSSSHDGGVYTYTLNCIDPEQVYGLRIALIPIAMALLGGSGLLLEPLLGVVFLYATEVTQEINRNGLPSS